MGTDKPPHPMDLPPRFPWEVFWETFAPEWERICNVDSDDAVIAFKGLCAQLEAAGRAVPTFSREKVAMLVDASPCDIADKDALADRLHRIGAAYLTPKLEAEHGFSSRDAKTQAEALARSADQFLHVLATMDMAIVLAFFMEQRFNRWSEQGPEDEERPPDPLTLAHVVHGLMDISDGAKAFAREVPTLRQGRSVDVFTRRLIRDAAIQIRDAGAGPITFSQSSGHEPLSEGARLLFGYLKLLNRQFLGQTVSSVLAEYDLHTSRPRGRPKRQN